MKADSKFKTLADLVAHAKANPGKAVFSGSGKGSANHLAQVRFDKLAGINSTYVAFKGTGASNAALLGGQVDASWGYTTSGTALGSQARVLAVAMEKHHPKFPDVPTLKELGFDIVSGAYRGNPVPKSTPEATRKKLSEMIGQINSDKEFQAKMIDGGFAMTDISYDKNAEFMKARSKEYIDAAKAGGILK